MKTAIVILQQENAVKFQPFLAYLGMLLIYKGNLTTTTGYGQ